MWDWLLNKANKSKLGPGVTTSEKRIRKILRAEAKKKPRITVTIPGHEESLQSHLVAYSPQRKLLKVDELLPRDADLHLISGKAITVDVQSPYRVLNFTTVIHKTGDDALLLEQPKEVFHQQNRSTFRAIVDKVHDVRVTLVISDRSPINGTLIDISSRGIGVHVKGSISPPLSAGTKVSRCIFTLPSHPKVQCKAKVCHTEYIDAKRLTLIGMKYETLTPKDQRIVDRFVNEVQRSQL